MTPPPHIVVRSASVWFLGDLADIALFIKQTDLVITLNSPYVGRCLIGSVPSLDGEVHFRREFPFSPSDVERHTVPYVVECVFQLYLPALKVPGALSGTLRPRPELGNVCGLSGPVEAVCVLTADGVADSPALRSFRKTGEQRGLLDGDSGSRGGGKGPAGDGSGGQLPS